MSGGAVNRVAGRRVAVGGGAPGVVLGRGAYYLPTFVAEVSPDAQIVREMTDLTGTARKGWHRTVFADST